MGENLFFAYVDPHHTVEKTDATCLRKVMGMRPTSERVEIVDPIRNIHRVFVQDDCVHDGKKPDVRFDANSRNRGSRIRTSIPYVDLA